VPYVSAQDAYPFGRLFTSEAERKYIDNRRDNGPSVDATIADDVIVSFEPSSQTTEVIVYSGFLRRGDGKYVLWIDGLSDLSAPNGLAGVDAQLNLNNDAAFHANGLKRVLKPGETWRLASDEVDFLVEHTAEPPVPESVSELISESVAEPDVTTVK
jgi:hypothetical protein